MKFVSFSLLLFIYCIANSKAQELPDYITENTSSFMLHVKGLNKAKGELRIAMFDSEKAYTQDPVYAVVLPVSEKEVFWEITSLPFGEYAIAVYHDSNINGKLDTNFLGIPKEEYGFSNNARGKFGPASWKEAKFSVSDRTSVHEITVD